MGNTKKAAFSKFQLGESEVKILDEIRQEYKVELGLNVSRTEVIRQLIRANSNTRTKAE